MIFTCDACHYTFQAETLPTSCPDCGKKDINRRVGTKVFSLPAVREATADEISWYNKVQGELKAEEETKAADKAAAEQRKSRIQSVNNYVLSNDEHNWATVLCFVFNSIDWTMLRKRVIAGTDPDWTERMYMDVRREFTRSINDDRSKLKKAGKSEPIAGVYDFTDDGFKLKDGLDAYGPALAVLYSFSLPDDHIFLHTPTLGDLRHIDLKAIAQTPSAAYIQLLLDWE